MHQQSFFRKIESTFGGSRRTSHPKIKRPLDSKLPIHLVLKANRSGLRHPKYLARVNELVQHCCRKHGVRVYEYANCGNHAHLLIRLRRRADWAAFVRELTGRIGHLLGGKLWKHRPFTRIVKGWQKAYITVKMYVRLNALEAEGVLSRDDHAALEGFRAEFSTG